MIFTTGSTRLPRPDSEYWPGAAALWDMRKHCEEDHGATDDDYRLDVYGWHRHRHPDCPAREPRAARDEKTDPNT